MQTITGLITITVFILFPLIGSADELNYNMVSLHSSAEKFIDNDVLIITMKASHDSSSHKDAAESVNKKMMWAKEQLRNKPDFKVQTLNYQTYPRYQNKTVIGWSVTQSIRIEGTDMEELAQTSGTLQEKLLLSSMMLQVSREKKQAAIRELISEALEAFRSKAELIAQSMSANDYNLVSISIHEDNSPIPITPVMRNHQMESMAAMAAPPQIEGGESKITVRVDGTIQLVF